MPKVTKAAALNKESTHKQLPSGKLEPNNWAKMCGTCTTYHMSTLPKEEQERMMNLQDHDMEIRAKMMAKRRIATIAEDVQKQKRRTHV